MVDSVSGFNSMKKIYTWLLIFGCVYMVSFEAFSQTDTTDEESELGQKTQNPLANLVVIPIQNNVSFNNTQNRSTGYIMNIQPVFPLQLGKLSIVNRLTFGFGYIPGITAGDDAIPVGAADEGRTGGTWGTLDLNYTGFFTPKSLGDFHWGIGPSITLPIASDNRMGSGKWSLGPSLAVVWQPGKWTFDAILRQLWSVGGNSERKEVNQLYLQPLAAYNLKHGWALATMPIVTTNWDEPEGERWLIPVGGGVNKLFKVNNLPILLMCHYYYHLVKPELAATSELRVQLSIILAK